MQQCVQSLMGFLIVKAGARVTDCVVDCDGDSEWGLPANFRNDAFLFSSYSILAFSRKSELPIGKCHETAMKIAVHGNIEGTDLRLCTGYARHESVWVRHSWVVNIVDNSLIECTPSEFDMYFGTVMSKGQTVKMRMDLVGVI
jgi:hypothetical protein